MTRTPDQDAADGLWLATDFEARTSIGGVSFGCAGKWQDSLSVWCWDGDDCETCNSVADITPDEADSMARVLQAWAERVRRQSK